MPRDWDTWALRHGYVRTNPGGDPAHYIRAPRDTPRMDSEAAQLEQLLPLIRHVARRHTGDEPEDLAQVAAIGALKALRSPASDRARAHPARRDDPFGD